jgi:penicillin-binding protein 1A
VFVQVGKKVGTKKVSRLARKMGVRTPVSTNLAIALGGLHQGVTPLDMAHAYETFANDGLLTYGTLSPGRDQKKSLPVPGPVGIERIDRVRNGKGKLVELPDGARMINKVRHKRVISDGIAREVGTILQTVVKKGSATRAQIPGVMIAGKTGTTENYGDAWFVGWTKEYTVAVWVGYPDKFKPMETEFQGEPVAGGTFPAGIWKTFMESLLKYDPLPKKDGGDGTGADLEPTATPSGDGTAPPPTTPEATVTPPPVTDDGGGTDGGGTGGATPDEQTPPPTQDEEPPPTQDEQQQQPPPTQATPPPTPPATDPNGGGQAAPPADGAAAAGTTG